MTRSRYNDLLRAACRADSSTDPVSQALDIGAIIAAGVFIGTGIYLYFTL